MEARVCVPERITMAGKLVRLEPIDPECHAQPLFLAAQGPGADPRIWDYMFNGPFKDQKEFTAWLEAKTSSKDPLYFAVVGQESHQPAGMVSYLRITPDHGVIEIGNIWFGPTLQRTRQATEAIFLLAYRAFNYLGYRRLEWKCDALNARSRRAAVRFGFSYEGLFRQHMIVKGRNRDTAWFAMLDREWPVIRTAFEKWLDPENFDDAGRQLRSLSTVRESLT